ncbi:putative transposase [Rhizobium sp. SJZ105]|nr:putative transposase [Rhizobium sp. SJZ105]
MSLVERKPGRPDGRRMLDDNREEIIRATINRYYLTKNRPGISQLVRDIQTNCVSAGLKPPHRRTIETRLQDIDLHKRAKRRGEAEIVKRTTAVPGGLTASRPLQIVQVDHTKADIFVVDEETRLPIGRPWLSLAMDVCSRMVTGFYLTMDAPSRLSTSFAYYTPSLTNRLGYESARSLSRGRSPASPRHYMSTTSYIRNASPFWQQVVIASVSRYDWIMM